MEIITDKKWLLFVIGQVLSNALKYTNEGKIKIYTDVHERLVIEDSGIGIAREDLQEYLKMVLRAIMEESR